MLDSVAAFVQAQAASPWVLVLVLVLAAADAFVPPVPSETVLIPLAALSVAADGPPLVLLGLAAGVGAVVGDTAVFALGRRWGPARLAGLRRWSLLRRALDVAARTLVHRGGLVVVLARYVPAGRVAVGLTAGATGYPGRRFAGFAVLAALSWSTWCVGVGALAGRWMEGNPLLGAAAGLGVAVVLGLAADRAGRSVLGRARPFALSPRECQ